MIGYKAFKKDSKGMYTDGMGATKVYWKVKEPRTIAGDLELCKHGFHFFEHLCFAINYLEKGNEIYKIEASGNIIHDTFKLCTNTLEVTKKVTKKELKELIKGNYNSGNYNSGRYNSGNYNSGRYNSGNYNSGNYNSGRYNSGNYNSGNYNSGNYNSGRYNSGNYNSGNYNSGNYNSGDCNSGNYNSGRYNSGNYNSGDCNSGNYNSGDCNSGDCNSGNYNSGNYNSGNGYINYFCTKTRFFLFDIEVSSIPEVLIWLDMEWLKLNLVDGYKKAWSNCPTKVLDILKSIPEFKKPSNIAKFLKITGIDLT